MADGQPKRIQQRRRMGWRKPPGTLSVARPGRWGNPHIVGRCCPLCPGVLHDQAGAVDAFERWVLMQPDLLAAALVSLAGHDLMCFCAPDAPCHAEVWLRLVN